MDAGIGVGWSTLDRGERGQLAALVEACVRLSLRLSAPLGAFRPKVSVVRRALRQPAYGAMIAHVAMALFTLVQ
jgi:hypothetical protein